MFNRLMVALIVLLVVENGSNGSSAVKGCRALNFAAI